MKLLLQSRTLEGATVLHCKGRVTYGDEVSLFSEKIAELLPSTRQLVIDLSEVQAIDSAGLGELVVVLMWAQASGCKTKIAANPSVIYLLELTNLLSVFETYPSLEEALACFRYPAQNSKASACSAA